MSKFITLKSEMMEEEMQFIFEVNQSKFMNNLALDLKVIPFSED